MSMRLLALRSMEAALSGRIFARQGFRRLLWMGPAMLMLGMAPARSALCGQAASQQALNRQAAMAESPASLPDLPSVRIDFRKPGLDPPHWVLVLHPDGSGQFDTGQSPEDGADAASGAPSSVEGMAMPELHRAIHVSAAYAGRVFTAAHRYQLFNYPCESHLKVAFQGWKRLSYQGQDGQGSCEFNYSKQKEIQTLAESVEALATTLVEGARLAMLERHDRLGLDREMQNLTEMLQDGRATEADAIRETLEKLANDEEVLERVRNKARELLGEK